MYCNKNKYKNILENLDIINGLKLCRDKKEARKYLKSKDMNLTYAQLHELRKIYCSNTENFEALSFETLSSVAAGNMVAIRGGEVHLIRGVHFEGEPQSKNIELYYDAHHGKGLPTMVTDVQLETMIIGKSQTLETESKAADESQLINLRTHEIKGAEIHNINSIDDLKKLADDHHFDYEKAIEYFYQSNSGKIFEILNGRIPKSMKTEGSLAIHLPTPYFSEHDPIERSQSAPLEKMHMGDLSDRSSEPNPAAHVVALDLGTVRNQAMTFISGHNLDDSAREVIHSVFDRYGDHLDQLLLTKLNDQLLSDNPGAAYNFFKFLSDIADPQKAKREVIPGITYGKFCDIIFHDEVVRFNDYSGQEVTVSLRKVILDSIYDYSNIVNNERKTLDSFTCAGTILKMKQEISTIAGADKETFISQVNAAAGLSEYFGSHCLFSIGNDVASEETVKNCGIYQESPEFYAFHLKACINMARTSKFIIDRLQFGDINSETDFIRECNETLRSIKPDIWVHDRNISDMQDSLFAIKLVAACEKAGIKLDANSLEYDEKGCFRCANTLRDYLKEHKPIDIDSLLNNEEGFTLENILEKCPEFSALPTTYQIEVLEHWRGKEFTEEEIIKWVFNNPEIFEIAGAFPKDQLDLHKHKRFLMLESVKILRERLTTNPNKEKYVLAYLRLMDERDIACDELEVAKGALPEISYFELLYELGILSHEAPNARSVHLKGLFVSDEALTVEQKIYRFYILGASNCTSEEINAISSYIEGVFDSNPKARNKAARNGKPYAKRAVEYLIDNYDQLTLADRKKLVKITSNRSNVTDEQKRALDCLSLSYLGIIGEEDKKSLEDVVLGKVDNIAQGEGSQLHNLLELSAQLTENARQTFLSHPELGKVYFNQINKLSFEQRKIILSVFDSMDQLLCEKISGYLLEQRFDAGTLFKFLSKIADPQNAKIELYPGITYSKFFEIISSKTKATMKIYDPTHNSWKSYDLREPFIDFMSNLISKGVLYKDRNLICAQLRLEFQEFYRKQFNELVIRSVDSTLPIYGMFAMGNDIISSDSFAIGIYQMSPQFYKFYFKACQNMTRYSRFIVNSLKFEALSSNGDFVVRCADKITEINPEIGMGTDREISDMQDGWFAIKLVAACKGKEAILLDENSLKYDDVGNFPCNESLRKYLIANKPKGIDEIIDNINELTLEKILEKCPELSALPVTYQIEVLESWRGIQFTKEEVIKWVFNNPEVFEIAACFKADQPCKYKGFLINETVKLLRERLKDDPNKEKYVFAYLRLIDKNECGFIGLNLQKGVLGNITYFELLHELGILPKDASSPDLSDINGIFPSEQELTTEQKIYKYCLLAAANSNEYETQAAQFYLDGYLTGKNKIAFEYLAINHDKMTLEQRKGFAYFAIDRVSALRSDIRKEDGQIKSYEAQKAELEKGVKVKAQKIEVHLAKSPDGTYYYVDEFTNNYVKYKGKVVEIDGDYYEISGCDDVQDLKVRIVDGKFYRDRTPDELAKYNAEIAKIDRDISLEKSKKSSYEAQIPIAQRLQEDIALLLTDQTPQEREALKLLQNPSALSDKDKKNLEHFAYRRTAVLQSQLKTKKEEYAILLQDRSEGSNSKKRDNISERLSLEEQIANSIEMDQEAIAILPSTVKEKEAARDKKLLIAGGVIGGVLGLGTVATVVLYCLGVFGGSGLPFVSVPIGGSSNDDSKDKPTA